MNKDSIRQILKYAGAIVLFAVLAYGFVPQVFSGKVLNQSDTSSWKGMTHEISEHNAAHPDDKTQWTNSMFGGMPTVTMYDDFNGDWTNPIYKFMMSGLRPANWLLISLIGAFLLMLAFGIDTLLAIAGAIAITFCSYNFQIIQVGHNTKMQAIAFMPWVLAGIVFTYRSALKGTSWRKWLPQTMLGSVLFALALSMQVKANHPQITYYLAIIIFLYAIAVFVSLCVKEERRNEIGRFFAASAMLLVIGGVGIATNLNKLIPTYEYTEYTMRGGSELSGTSESHNDKGLDLDYATAWSYGIGEMPNLMIPNFNGGASTGELGKDSETYRLLKRAGQPNLNSVMKSLPLYWGPQPFTAGPMYMGAITVFLFLLGLCLYRGKEKWWLLAATLIAIFLAWGSHFMWFTKLWFSYAPMYNKFRTVSMALVTLQITLPVLGFIVLDKIFRESYPRQKVMAAGWIAYGLSAGFCLLLAIFPGIAGTFSGSVDAGQPDVLIEALAADRRHLLVKDAMRSFTLITITWAIIIWAYKVKEPFVVKGRIAAASAVICFAVLFDLYSAGKRYLDKDDFVTKKDFSSQFAERPADKIIHEDTDLDYRVLDISVNTFNDAHQSYQHRCIGGYSPAKMQRYQDLIERYLTGEINSVIRTVNGAQTIQDVESSLPYLPITSMLNGKYIIIGGEYPPVENRYAFGNAWLVDSAVAADTPDDEIALLRSTDLRSTAVIGRDFGWAMEKLTSASASRNTANAPQEEAAETMEDHIEMVSYAANELRYHYNVSSDRAVIFSEIYYPDGWKAWIEPAGEYGNVKSGSYIPTDAAVQADMFRADWILRGTFLPAGEGELVMRFEPQSYRTGAALSRASSILLLILLLLSAGGVVMSGKKGR
ncbi:MAG: 7TM-DISM domain-containing protein [Bacteroidales bacterium]|nr:7TM-DISM domain-containing protein [Bacteroidales bacterium]MDE7127557.1 7TM-DISM domain-containing protein [Bacteroidales bacterium]